MTGIELKALLKEPEMAERTLRFGSEVNEATIQSCLEKILQIFYEDQQKEIILHLSTGGGLTFGSHSFYQTIRLYNVNLITIASGSCASAGGPMFLSVQKEQRFSLPTTTFLLHPPRVTYKEKRMGSKELKEELENILIREEFEKEIFIKETNITEEEYQKHILNDVFFSAQEAKQYGFVHEIITL